MENSMIKQAANFLREQKNKHRRLAIFLCLAAVVLLGTVGALKLTGHAMVGKEKVLDCPYSVHKHTKSCYNKDKELTCGLADYVIHEHNDDCYDADGKLVCKLPEVKEHKHKDSCYKEEKVLTCDKEETKGHEHTKSCYEKEKGDLTCEKEEHTHGEKCYDEEGKLICDKKEHEHSDKCYEWNEVLTCGKEEGEGGHSHDDSCYETKKVLTCGKLEVHVHDEKKCYKDGKLICDKIVLEKHQHGEGCFVEVETTAEETKEAKEEKKETEEKTTEAEVSEEVTEAEETTEIEAETSEEVTNADEAKETEPETAEEVTEAGEGKESETEVSEEVTEADEAEGTEPETAEDVTEAEETKDAESETPKAEDVTEAGESKENEAETSEEAAPIKAPEGETVPTETAAENETTGTGTETSENLPGAAEIPAGDTTTQTWQDESVIITATYDASAGLPENAQLQAYAVNEQTAPERYEQRAEEARQVLGLTEESTESEEEKTPFVIYNIGFYVDGKEVEPTGPVTITMQFLDEDGIAAGDPVSIVHFGQDGAEVLPASDVDGENKTSFQANSFADGESLDESGK